MELTDLKIALQRYWFITVAAFAFWLLVGSFMAFTPSPRYESTASLIAEPPDQTVDAIQLAGYQLPVILATLQSRSFTSGVRDSMPPALRNADISINVVNEPGTPLLYITVNADDPKVAATWATALARGAVEERSGSVMQLTVLDTAAPSNTPVSPKKVPILFGATVLGALSGILAAVLVYRTRRALDVVKEIERRLGMPVIGRIPMLRALQRSSATSGADLITTTPELVEAFQSLRTNLEVALLGAASDSQIISVASWGEGEGKSTVAAGLALVTAATGTDVLAIDVDLRRPGLHTRLGVPFGPGVADVGRDDIGALVVRTGHRHLSLLRAGTPSRHPADVLAMSLEDIIDFAQAKSWRAILDPPPYHGVAETTMVLSAAQYVLLVVDVRRSKMPELEAMTDRLRSSGVNVIGVVLNRVPRSHTESAYAPYQAQIRPKRERTRQRDLGLNEPGVPARQGGAISARRVAPPPAERPEVS